MNKEDFPIFRKHKNLVYLDNAATSQRPKAVIQAVNNFSENENANIQRGVYTLSVEATEKYEAAHKIVEDFINAGSREVVFTKNTTESINLLAYTIDSILPKGKDEILLTEMEHHSNLVPWQQFAKRLGMKLKFIKIKDDYTLDYEDAKEKINEKTAILSFTHISNVLGTRNDVNLLCKLGKEVGAITIVDAAQSVGHIKVDVKDIGCDFLVFSSHKMLGPTGIGVLYGREELLEKLRPFQFGGGMIKSVTQEDATWADLPEKFEAGTQNIAESIGLAKAIEYIREISLDNIEAHDKDLLEYTLKKLGEVQGIKIYNPGPNKSGPIVSFNLDGAHAHDVASLLNDDNIAVRAGHHCALPLMEKIGATGTVRVSSSVFNTEEDIDSLVEGLKKIKEMFAK